MNIVTRKRIFETNSSSMHSLVLAKNNHSILNKEKIEKQTYIYNGELFYSREALEFERYPFNILSTFKDKLAYIISSYNSSHTNNETEEYIESVLQPIIKQYLGDNAHFEFQYKQEFYSDYEKRYGYVDHQSSEMLFNTLNTFCINIEDFLINEKYIIVIDGDEYDVFGSMLESQIINESDIEILSDYNGYENGNYHVAINRNDGTKIRFSNDEIFNPEFAESIDLTITKKCSKECPYCYLSCNKNGRHANLKKYNDFFDSIKPYTEVAINGNDLDTPDMQWMIEKLFNNNVTINITISQDVFESDKFYNKSWLWMISGIGISYQRKSNKLIQLIKNISHPVIHVINGVASQSDFEFLSENLKNSNCGLLILGYKDVGRGFQYLDSNENDIKKNSDWLLDNLEMLQESFNVVAFDNLAIEQLKLKDKIDDETFKANYMGDEGAFTFYVDLVDEKYAKHSYAYDNEKHDIDVMDSSSMFNIIKQEGESKM